MMMTEITIELTTITKTSDITSEQVLNWARRVELKRAQKVVLTSIQKNKEFDVRHMKPKTQEHEQVTNYEQGKVSVKQHSTQTKKMCSGGEGIAGSVKSNNFQKVARAQLKASQEKPMMQGTVHKPSKIAMHQTENLTWSNFQTHQFQICINY